MKNRLLILLLLAVSASIQAQTDQQYGFICYGDNHILCDTASPNLDHFIQKWNRVVSSGEGNINIVHIGGSHVQAGTMTHRIRCNILSEYPSLVGPRGMIFPYSAAAKCNNPADYRVHCVEKVQLTRNVYKEPEHNMGLCGISVTIDTPTSIQIVLNEPRFDFATNQVVIIGESSDSIIPTLRLRDREVYPSYLYPKYHRYVYNLSRPVDSFNICIPCQEGEEFTLMGIYLSNRSNGISYHSIGVNGAAVPDYLKCVYLKDDLRLVKPDLVVFGIGINDASGSDFDTVRFRQNYQRLIDTILSVNPHCAFLFITNNDSFRKVRRSYQVNTNGRLAQQVFYRLAHDNKAALWDQFKIMGGLKSMDKWRSAKLAQNDRVHFTHAGYQLIGDLFSQAFFEWIASYSKPVPQTSSKSSDSERYQYISY